MAPPASPTRADPEYVLRWLGRFLWGPLRVDLSGLSELWIFLENHQGVDMGGDVGVLVSARAVARKCAHGVHAGRTSRLHHPLAPARSGHQASVIIFRMRAATDTPRPATLQEGLGHRGRCLGHVSGRSVSIFPGHE